MVNKIDFQLISVHNIIENHLNLICEVMEGD